MLGDTQERINFFQKEGESIIDLRYELKFEELKDRFPGKIFVGDWEGTQLPVACGEIKDMIWDNYSRKMTWAVAISFSQYLKSLYHTINFWIGSKYLLPFFFLKFPSIFSKNPYNKINL